ncbi:Fic/DOC family protein [Desulfonema limicola]|uniref:Fic/DOC family protein n=1 Tax=Desulfonema limicola TaxID=45656 RepID=A0A975GFP9_9BACT|nr:Fic family protein [Desulfonema limicola]QTA79395.1 Fic/DOC family protein [Desulfonema limicola]
MDNILNNLDKDIRKLLVAQLRNLWTHTSTAIEGNTLTLGETAFVIEEGLTVSGKPLKDHQEVVGHARAIDLIYDLIKKDAVSEKNISDLHKAVQTEAIFDVYKPVGKWKVEPNWTSMIDGDKQVMFEYAAPGDVPILMTEWLNLLNSYIKKELLQEDALDAYARLHISFVRIHPFYDGNGRIARLVSNIPVLKSGFPPIIIPKQRRREYIMALTEYHLSAGPPIPGEPLLPETEKIKNFKIFCAESWKESIELVNTAQRKHAERYGKKHTE